MSRRMSYLATTLLVLIGSAASALPGTARPGFFTGPPYQHRRQTSRPSAVLTLSPEVLDTASVPFIPHAGNGAFDNYLALNVPYAPVRALYEQVARALAPLTLKSRGEAHVTVVTPPEYWNVLRSRLTMDDVHRVAQEGEIQASDLEVRCLGVGAVAVDGKRQQTFFVVVRSEKLLALRRTLRDLFVERGGGPDEFAPDNYHPHVTVGFTQRDLHEADGVIKDEQARDPRFDLQVR